MYLSEKQMNYGIIEDCLATKYSIFKSIIADKNIFYLTKCHWHLGRDVFEILIKNVYKTVDIQEKHLTTDIITLFDLKIEIDENEKNRLSLIIEL